MSGRHRSGSKKAPPEIGLHMECVEEELEPSQVAFYNKAEKEFSEVEAKLDNYIKKLNAEVVESGEDCVVLQINATPPAPAIQPMQPITQVTAVPTVGTGTQVKLQTTQSFQQVVGPGILTRSTTTTGGNTFLVMDPRLGLVVGQVPQTTVAEQAPAPPLPLPPSAVTPKQTPTTRPRQGTTATPVIVTRARSGKKSGATSDTETASTVPVTRTREKTKSGQTTPPISATTTQTVIQQQVFAPAASSGTTTTTGSYRVKANAKQLPPPAKPTENNALGGLSAGSKTPWKPNSDEGKSNLADSKEVTFNKLSGKTFPSLVVVARPHLRLKYIPQSNVSQERNSLDAKVKGVLMYTPSKFTEWLIQQGLIRSEQICQTHVNNDLTPVKLKLGMYSDVSKFQYSGGYVWISECCPSQFVSVYSGSLFEGAPHPPTTLLKLIYHWACQTNVQNVVQWVKVDNFYVKTFFTNMRAVCTQAVHQKYQKIGGARKKVEVGVISLGTTSQDGNMRQVKVEVLGVMDPESKMIRLRAVEPLSDDRNFKRRFIKILEPLEEWVHKESAILTDFTVDKGTLNNMGFHTVYQVSITDPPSKYSNQNVMEYLRRIVPRMFQNTLSLLSRQIIQQFLDELVWREMWGPIASQAFVNIIAHMGEQTKLDVADSLLLRLSKVAANPFKNWNFAAWKPITVSVANTKVQTGLPSPTTSLESVPLISRLASESRSPSPPPLKNRARKRTADQAEVEPPTTTSGPKKPLKISPKEKTKKEEKPKPTEKVIKKEKVKSEEKEISEDALAFIKQEDNKISLSSYYYGTKRGDRQIIASEYKGKFSVKCCVCNKRFTDNIVIMKHMILHCQDNPVITVDLKKAFQCNYCFLGFNAQSTLKSHLEGMHYSTHSKSDKLSYCQICDSRLRDTTDLIFHMHRTHVELELPYECGVCHLRTSSYKIFTDHFVQVHKGGEHVFCPYCLKVVALSHKGKVIPANTLFYINHLEKHHRKSLARDCYRCRLSFIHGGILDQHLEADHVSIKSENGTTGVRPIWKNAEVVLMPVPGNVIKPILPPKYSTKYLRSPKSFHTTTKFRTLEVSGLEDDMACAECEGTLKSDHFVGILNCQKCRFSTCCEKAMQEHMTIFHESTAPQFTLGKPVVLSDEMFCVCGFASRLGNRLAKHIAICERKSAYPSEEDALAAIRRSDWNRLESPVNQSGETHNMLNSLGLVRKSPETSTSTSQEAAKKEHAGVTDVTIKQERLSQDQPETEAQVDDARPEGSNISVEEDKNLSIAMETDPEPETNPLTEAMDVDKPQETDNQEGEVATGVDCNFENLRNQEIESQEIDENRINANIERAAERSAEDPV